jgi:hypothetical protein
MTGDITITKSSVDLANVNNTSDASKPVSTATLTALGAKADTAVVNPTLLLKAPLASPKFTGSVAIGTSIPAASAALFILYGPLAPIVISTVTYTAFVAALATSAQEYPALEPYIETISELYLEYSTVSLLSNEVKNKILQKLKEVVEIIADERVKDVNVSDPILNNVLRNITRSGAVIKPLLQDFRKEMILEGIRQTKIEARILVRKIMKEEFRIMAANFAAHIYTKPTITNLRTYFLNTDTKLIAPNNKLRYFDVAIDAEDNPLNSITIVPAEPLIVNNPEGYFILERYIRIQDREIPLSGTVIPDEIKNRPENINGVVNVTAFKNWISTLSTETKQTEMYKLFGDLFT